MTVAVRTQRLSAVIIGGLSIASAAAGALAAFAPTLSDQTNQAAWCTIAPQEVYVDDYTVTTPEVQFWCP